MKKIKTVAILLAFAVLIATVYFVNEHRNDNPRLTEYEYANEDIPDGFDGFKIMMISDLHNAPFGEKISRYIIDEKPDITIFLGDMVQLPDDDLTETIKIVQRTKDVTDFYAVTGNHDMQNDHMWLIVEELEDAGVCMIDSRDETIERKGDKICLAGLADPMDDELSLKAIEKIRKTIKEIISDKDMFTILAVHRSVLYPDINDLGADLILSGHLHGGIVRLPFVGGVVGEKAHNLFPDYEYGLYEEDGRSSMIVSGGCDKNPKKKRFFNPPEVVMVTLKSVNGDL